MELEHSTLTMQRFPNGFEEYALENKRQGKCFFGEWGDSLGNGCCRVNEAKVSLSEAIQ